MRGNYKQTEERLLMYIDELNKQTNTKVERQLLNNKCPKCESGNSTQEATHKK
jgi:hypothetical protein